MLSYQHGYHAGSFADVVKHLTLTRILSYLTIKEKPLFYLETHAGRGLYNLRDKQANQTKEYLRGVQLLWEKQATLSSLFMPYLQCLRKFNPQQTLDFYLGSPAFALELLRPSDRLTCCELHPREFEALKTLNTKGRAVFLSQEDGLICLNALLPPKERRAVIFIDPAYEIKTEYKDIPKAINFAYQKFATGVYCLWYPLLDEKLNQQLLRGMQAFSPKALRLEFYLNANTIGMTACGLWIINPPYTLKEEMDSILQDLCKLLNPGKATYIVESWN